MSVESYLRLVEGMDAAEIGMEDVVFEERSRLQCLFCPRHNTSWMCPPRLPDLDYYQALSEYRWLVLAWVTMKFTAKTYQEVRRESTMRLHLRLLEAEGLARDRGWECAVSFIGGSCKLCAEGCAPDKCRQPGRARPPLEAIGVNVTATARNAGLELSWPVFKKMELTRVGLLAYGSNL